MYTVSNTHEINDKGQRQPQKNKIIIFKLTVFKILSELTFMK